MWVHWKGAGVKGYTDEKTGRLQAGIQSPSKASKTVDADLWYGTKPDKTDSTFLNPENKKQASVGTLRSFARMSLGRQPKGGDKEKTVRVDIEFEANSFALANGQFLYTLSWHNRLATDSTINLEWPSRSIVDSWVKSAREHEKDPIDFDRLMKLTKEPKGIHIVAKSPPVYETLTVTLSDMDHEEIGSTTVSLYRPVDGKEK
jgi:hypothetical protein